MIRIGHCTRVKLFDTSKNLFQLNLTRASSSKLILTLVQRDAINPSRQPGFVSKPRQATIDLHEDYLQHIFRPQSLAERIEREVVHPIAKEIVQPPEGSPITSSCRLDQLTFLNFAVVLLNAHRPIRLKPHYY